MIEASRIELSIKSESPDEVRRLKEIFLALLTTGALTGVRGGKAIIHFDSEGIFQGVELDYWPWRRRKVLP